MEKVQRNYIFIKLLSQPSLSIAQSGFCWRPHLSESWNATTLFLQNANQQYFILPIVFFFAKTTVCKRNYLSPYGILLAELPPVAVLFISINNNALTMMSSVLVDNYHTQVRNKCRQVIPFTDCETRKLILNCSRRILHLAIIEELMQLSLVFTN